MTYQDLLKLLFLKRERKIPKSLREMNELIAKLGNPQHRFPSIHIAGTNGKGSVATKIAKSLEYSGYKVGLFTSPHIQRFEERIQINGVEIVPLEVEKRLLHLLELFPGLCFFDYATFLAFQYFSEKNVDIAIIEAGIGGLHDTTNLIHPLISVITSVAFDHLELLGPTLDDIAYQKAGIIKAQVPVIVGPKAHFEPIFKQAEAMRSLLIKVPPQRGDYDEENQAIASAALKQLKNFLPITDAALEKGVLAKPPCRFERCGRFVLDVAHNSEGFESLLKAWNLRYPGKPKNAILGFSSDKDLKTCLTMIAEQAEHLFLVQAESTRAAPLEKLKDILIQEKIFHFTACRDVAEAIGRALAQNHDILVCGSFYIMKQAREEILRRQIG